MYSFCIQSNVSSYQYQQFFSNILENTKGNIMCIRKIVLYMVFGGEDYRKVLKKLIFLSIIRLNGDKLIIHSFLHIWEDLTAKSN